MVIQKYRTTPLTLTVRTNTKGKHDYEPIHNSRVPIKVEKVIRTLDKEVKMEANPKTPSHSIFLK